MAKRNTIMRPIHALASRAKLRAKLEIGCAGNYSSVPAVPADKLERFGKSS
jgi:hypothetical protein